MMPTPITIPAMRCVLAEMVLQDWRTQGAPQGRGRPQQRRRGGTEPWHEIHKRSEPPPRSYLGALTRVVYATGAAIR